MHAPSTMAERRDKLRAPTDVPSALAASLAPTLKVAPAATTAADTMTHPSGIDARLPMG